MRRRQASITRTDVVVVDDHALVTDLICDSFRTEGLLAHPIVAYDVATAAAELGRVETKVAVFDLVLGDQLTTPLIGRLTDTGVNIIVLTGVTDPTRLGAALDAGALAVVSKSEAFSSLLHATHTALADNRQLSVANAAAIREAAQREQRRRQEALGPFQDLTGREREILLDLMSGLVAVEISDRSGVSVATVRSHIKALLRKLGVHSQLAAVALAHSVGWPGDHGPSAPTTQFAPTP